MLIIAVTEQEYMRDHFENVLAENLEARGGAPIPSNKIFPQPGAKLDREVIAAKIREMGIGNVLVGPSVSKKEVSQLIPGGTYFVPVNYYNDWYGFYTDSFVALTVPGAAYDAEYIQYRYQRVRCSQREAHLVISCAGKGRRVNTGSHQSLYRCPYKAASGR